MVRSASISDYCKRTFQKALRQNKIIHDDGSQYDVMFSGKSVYVSRRLMAIEPMTALNLLLLCELTHSPNEEIKTKSTFLHHRFWA